MELQPDYDHSITIGPVWFMLWITAIRYSITWWATIKPIASKTSNIITFINSTTTCLAVNTSTSTNFFQFLQTLLALFPLRHAFNQRFHDLTMPNFLTIRTYPDSVLRLAVIHHVRDLVKKRPVRPFLPIWLIVPSVHLLTVPPPRFRPKALAEQLMLPISTPRGVFDEIPYLCATDRAGSYIVLLVHVPGKHREVLGLIVADRAFHRDHSCGIRKTTTKRSTSETIHATRRIGEASSRNSRSDWKLRRNILPDKLSCKVIHSQPAYCSQY